MYLYLIFLLIGCANCLQAADLWSKLRLQALLPYLETPLCVEPALPQDFVAMSRQGPLTCREWTYWGPKAVLEAYFQNPASLAQAIIRVKVSESIKQIGPQKFNEDNDELIKSLASLRLKRMYDIKRAWGRYPIYIVAAEFPEKWLHAAWIGLDDGIGTTLMLELVYPKSGLQDRDYKLWNDFFAKTTTLPEPIYSDGYKVQYQVGKTELTIYGKKIQIKGEERRSDNTIQLVSTPQDRGLEFVLEKVTYELMAPNHALGGPAARCRGKFTILAEDGSRRQSTQEILVLIQPVDEFNDTSIPSSQVYQEKLTAPLKELVVASS